MNTFLINSLLYIVRKLITGGLLDTIKQIVLLYATNDNLTGAQKKEAVVVALKKLEGDEKEVFLAASGNLINLAIESAVVWAKLKTAPK